MKHKSIQNVNNNDVIKKVCVLFFFLNLVFAQDKIELKQADSLSSIQKISENIASDIIENISGDKLNESSIKATVDDISKKNINKYL